MSKKTKTIGELKEENLTLQYEIELLNQRILQLAAKNQAPTIPVAEKKKINWNKHAADISFDFWPLSDWIRFSYKSYRPGQYWQLCIGPIRTEFYAA